MTTTGARATAVALAAGLALAACGASTKEVSSITRTPADPKAIVEADTAFTLDLYRAMAGDTAGKSGNLVVSPHGADVVLSMILAGAKGQTADEIRTALRRADAGTGANASTDGGVADLAALEQTLRTRSHDRVTLELAASEWVEKTFAIHPEYRDLIERTFGAVAHQVDFIHQPRQATDTINADIAKATHGHIPRLLTNEIDAYTRLVLVSTAFLDAKWALPFKAWDTQPADFTTLAGEVVQRPTMRHTGDYSTGTGEGWRAIELPYSARELSMLAIVPDTGSLDAFQKGLDSAKLASVVAAVETNKAHPVDLSLPKFDFRTHGSLKPPLQSLGVHVAFTDAADLTGIAPNLMVSDVVQEAWVKVDEEGTQAAAATAGVVAATSLPVPRVTPERFAVDHPFLFAIRDNATGAVLFLGRVVDPQA